MSLIAHEDATDDVFNYTDPDYAHRITSRIPLSPVFFSERVEYCDPTETQNQLAVRYEPSYKQFELWQAKTGTSQISTIIWDRLLATLKTKADDELVGSSTELAEILREINDLAFEDEEDKFGPIRPTYHALKHCMRLVLELAAGARLVKPSDITTDHNGDIRISWARGTNEAELVCPSEGRPYIYYSSDQTYGTEIDATIDRIAQRVRWAMDVR